MNPFDVSPEENLINIYHEPGHITVSNENVLNEIKAAAKRIPWMRLDITPLKSGAYHIELWHIDDDED